uniref:Uncharacterized protein n=1 Tax=Podoviridae sp. ctxJ29 TaxID=2827754 RepID=A0A8S5S799_9CAUD|nr:MAG TPA: hypothetical protein [Podoviridae sp. ctxJ29]
MELTVRKIAVTVSPHHRQGITLSIENNLGSFLATTTSAVHFRYSLPTER